MNVRAIAGFWAGLLIAAAPPIGAQDPAVSPAELPGVRTAPVPPEPPRRTGPPMNEMTGLVYSVDHDARLLRLTVEGGYNVGFSYDFQTTVVGKEAPKNVAGLDYGDKVIVRYAGREMMAREIEKIGRGAPPVPAAAPEAPPPAPEEAPPVSVSTPSTLSQDDGTAPSREKETVPSIPIEDSSNQS